MRDDSALTWGVGEAFIAEMSVPRTPEDKYRHKDFIGQMKGMDIPELIRECIKWHDRFADSPHLYEDWFAYQRTLLICEELRRRGVEAELSSSERLEFSKILYDHLEQFGCEQFSGESYG